MSTPNSENKKFINEETSPSSILPKTSLKYDFRDVNFGGGFAGRDYTGNVIHNYTDASLNETVAKIETLINDLCRNSPVNSTSQQMTIATQVIGAIEDDLDWRQKTIQACQQGLLEAIKTNPIGAFVAGAIEGWQ